MEYLVVGGIMLVSLMTYGYAAHAYAAELKRSASVPMGLDTLFSARWLVASVLASGASMHVLGWPYVGLVLPAFLLYALCLPIRHYLIGRYLGVDCQPLDKWAGFQAFQQRIATRDRSPAADDPSGE